jgi:hypothetical protein
MGQSTTPRQRELFAVFLLALFPAANALQPRLDEDTWWHLAVGRYVVEHHAVPTEDPFSRISQEQHIPWVAYSWLHEVGLYGAYQIGGLNGILACRHLLDSLTFVTLAWFVLRNSGGRPWAVAVLALVTAGLVPMMLERPWHYTIAFTTLTLNAVLDWRAGAPARRFWWLVPLFALWANLHIQFVLGLGLLGLGFGVTLVERWRRGESLRPLACWVALSVGCAVATLANPYHVRLYAVVWEYATQTGAMRVVTELAPPDFLIWWNWALLALLAWAAVTCVVRRCPLFDTALVVIGAAFGLRMQRDIWFGSLMAAAVITRLPAVPRGADDRSKLPGILAATALALLMARVLWELGPGSMKTATDVNRIAYPAGAAEYLRVHRPPGPLYNDFNWGGYLIWALPEYPVGLDGRTNLYGEERLQRYHRTWFGLHDWTEDPDLRAAGVVICPKPDEHGKGEPPLTRELRAAPDHWRVAYEDDTAAVFVPVK